MAGILDFLDVIREERKKYAAMETRGERFTVPREGKAGVDTILYRPQKAGGKLPVIFNMHGGAWIGGDAVLMETFCQYLADSIPAFVVNVNYVKADVQPFPYAQTEVCDAVKYFRENSDKYGIDTRCMAVGGHSAGAHIAAGAAMMLKEQGIDLACQMLVYPCVDMEKYNERFEGVIFPDGNFRHRWASPLLASDAELSGLAPAVIIVCGIDELRPHGIGYAKRLMGVSVPVKIREYPKALHGFLEVNRPDYPADDRQNPEQAGYARDCERYLANELRACFNEAANCI